MDHPPPVIPDYQAPPSRRIGVRGVIAFAAVVTCTLYLLVFQINACRFNGSQADPWTKYADVDRELRSLAQKRQNVELHLLDPDPQAQAAVPLTRIYFAACYLLYPNRAFVGRDDTVINFPIQLDAADRLPPVDWMKQHQISAVALVYGVGLVPNLRVVPLP